MIDFSIRDAIPQDAVGIAEVHVKTWQCAYRGQIPDDYLDALSLEKRTKTWKQALENPKDGVFVFVADLDDKVIGWCTAGSNRDGDVSKETGELHGIYVDPEYIGQGVGSKLMGHALQKLNQEGYARATLWVLDTNEKSRKFYEKKGWEVEGKTKDEPRDGFCFARS
jgi:ribosomal protein S18 acetylase RimI-like enzyme